MEKTALSFPPIPEYPCNLATSEGEENDEGWMTGCLLDEGMKREESRAGVHSCEHKKRRLK